MLIERFGKWGARASERGVEVTVAFVIISILISMLSPSSASALPTPKPTETVLYFVLIILYILLTYSILLFYSAHGVEVVATPVSRTNSAAILPPVEVQGTSTVFAPESVLWAGELLYLVPPAVLLYAGYMQYREDDDWKQAIRKVVTGYGIDAFFLFLLIAVLNLSLIELEFLTTPIRLGVANPVEALLLVGIIYPVVFGGVGVLIGRGRVASDNGSYPPRQPENSGEPTTTGGENKVTNKGTDPRTRELQQGDVIKLEHTVRRSGENTPLDPAALMAGKRTEVGGDNVSGSSTIVLGDGDIFKPAEEEMIGGKVGDSGVVTIPANEAFGEYDPDKVCSVPIDQISDDSCQEDANVTVDGRRGTVETMIGRHARVDFNHPLAGEDIVYKYEILERVEDE